MNTLVLVFAITAVFSSSPVFLEREKETRVAFTVLENKFSKLFREFKSILQREDPALLQSFHEKEPKPVAYGYQILPEIDLTYAKKPTHQEVSSQSYSWPITKKYIDHEQAKLEEFEQKLNIISKLNRPDRKPVLEKMAKDYGSLESDMRLIDNHIKHISFWQKQVAEDPHRFELNTRYHDAVLLRQEIADYLKEQNPTEKKKKLARVTNHNFLGQKLNLEEMQGTDRDDKLKHFLDEIDKKIFSINHDVEIAPFIKIKQASPTKTIFEVALYTDIEDSNFLKRVEQSIEKVWFLEVAEKTFQMDVLIKKFKPKQTPRLNKPYNLSAYAKSFPRDGGKLLSGGETTYSVPRNFMALGPHPVTAQTLGHEFGHILGFIDSYFRGMRDLGKDGFEILEIIPDPSDIMCNPNEGIVKKQHFEKILSVIKARRKAVGTTK